MLLPLRSLQRNHRIFVAAVAHPAFGEDAVPCDPVDGLGVGLLRVGLEDEPLAGAPAAGVDQRVEALGEFVLVVMRVAVGGQVRDRAGRGARRGRICSGLAGRGRRGSSSRS
jgi:hypothetical protein